MAKPRKGPGIGFDAPELLADGTVVKPVEQNGNRVLVNVLDGAGLAQKTGWVHSAFLV